MLDVDETIARFGTTAVVILSWNGLAGHGIATFVPNTLRCDGGPLTATVTGIALHD